MWSVFSTAAEFWPLQFSFFRERHPTNNISGNLDLLVPRQTTFSLYPPLSSWSSNDLLFASDLVVGPPGSNIVTMATFVDHYAVLGIEPTAKTSEIKKTYHRLALKYHPDKAAPGSKADSSKFIGILAAYEVLIDDSQRKPYDVQYKKHSNGTTTHRATHATQPRQGETSGGFSGGFWSYPEHFGEGRQGSRCLSIQRRRCKRVWRPIRRHRRIRRGLRPPPLHILLRWRLQF